MQWKESNLEINDWKLKCVLEIPEEAVTASVVAPVAASSAGSVYLQHSCRASMHINSFCLSSAAASVVNNSSASATVPILKNDENKVSKDASQSKVYCILLLPFFMNHIC